MYCINMCMLHHVVLSGKCQRAVHNAQTMAKQLLKNMERPVKCIASENTCIYSKPITPVYCVVPQITCLLRAGGILVLISK